MIRSIYFPSDGVPSYDTKLEDIASRLEQPDGLLWLDLMTPGPDEINSILGKTLKFHPLSIEDCLGDGYQAPKVDDFGDYILIIAQAIIPGNKKNNFIPLETHELDIFLGRNFVVTVSQKETSSAVDQTWEHLSTDERLHRNGSDFLCHAILDYLVDEYFPVLEAMDEEIDWLEDQVLSSPRPEILKRILDLKRGAISLRRIISPQREIMNRLSRDEFPFIDEKARIYFRDIHDHLVRIQDISETIRDMVSSALDIYLNSTSLKLNETMKALTILSTVFLPLSFISGVFGMNFLYNPAYSWQEGMPIFILICLSIVVLMVLVFKWRKYY